MILASVFIAQSVDGFIAREDGDIKWLEEIGPTEENVGYEDFIASVDALVMGKNSFLKVLTFGFWPYEGIDVFVMSRSLKEGDIPDEFKSKIYILKEGPRSVCEYLENKGKKHLYIDGGQIIQAFIREKLIQQMIVTTIPVLIGKGIPLFGHVSGDIQLKLNFSKKFQNDMIQNSYKLIYKH